MMSMDAILEKVKSGSLTPEEAGMQVRKILMQTSAPSPGDSDYADNLYRRMVDKDDDGYESSFAKVVSAWSSGDLSDGQYHTIREAALGNASAGEPVPEED